MTQESELIVADTYRKRGDELQTISQADNSPMALIAMAVKRGDSIESIRELMALKREWEADEARKAFNVAFAAFKSKCVKIVKRTEVLSGPLKGTFYANLQDVVDAATPALSEFGLSAKWPILQDKPDWIEVECVISHVDGHSERTSFGGPPDTGPGRNAIQARGSTLSYLQKYTFTAITGLAAGKSDTDGVSEQGGAMPLEVLNAHLERIDMAATKKELQTAYTMALYAADDLKDVKAQRMISEAKNERLGKL